MYFIFQFCYSYVVNRNNQKGQAVLIVLLSLSVVLIIVLFIMSRSITDISLSTREEDALRAFSAAEAGVERALVTGSNTGQLEIEDATFNATVSEFADGASEVVYPISLKSGEIATFWFRRAGETNSFNGSEIKYCWGDDGTSATNSPALEVTIFYTTTPNDLTTLRVARATLDADASRRGSNHFGTALESDCLIGDETFAFQGTLNMASLNISNYAQAGVLQYSTAKVLYNTTTSHRVGIDVSGTGSVLPSQGSVVVSDGSYGNSNRKVEVYQLHPEVPSIFANALFSSSGIIK